MVAFRCPHCGADIAWDPTKESMKCEYCDSVITVEDYNAALSKQGYYVTNELSCTQCGAVVYSTDTTMATFCSYCGSSVLLRNRVVHEKKPDYIIPFKVSKQKAESIYRKKVHSILLAPNWMEEDATVDKFRGIYMPFHLFRFHSEGEFEGEGTTFGIETENHKKYDVTRTYHLKAPVVIDYDFIPADASSSFPDSISRAICPFKKKDMVPFEEPFIAGYYADSADVSSDLYVNKYEALAKRNILSQPTIKAGSIEVPAEKVIQDMDLKTDVSKSVFPVWFMSYRHKDKISYAAVNGQTGEIAADIPISFGKYLIASVIVAALISIIFNVFFTLTPSKLLFGTAILSFIVFFMANSLLNDTYRRKKHYDDVGYMGEDQDKIKENKNYSKTKSKVGGILKTIVIFFGISFLIGISDEMGIGIILEMTLPVIIVLAIIYKIVMSFKKQDDNGISIKKKSTPFYYKILTLIKPIIAMGAASYIAAVSPVSDMPYYIAAFVGIAMIILTAFDVVRIQNKFTMRDLPLFTERRGGED